MSDAFGGIVKMLKQNALMENAHIGQKKKRLDYALIEKNNY